MKRKLFIILVASLLLAAPVLAQISAQYDLSWHVIAGGGGSMQTSRYQLGGTLGQSFSGPANTTGYALNSGFWNNFSGSAPAPGHSLLLPVVMGGS